jgi:hypothetical protein
MGTWNLTLTATVDRETPQGDAHRLGRLAAGDQLLSVVIHGPTFGLLTTAEADDPFAALHATAERLTTTLAENGYTVQGWRALECLTPEETERRLSAASFPELINSEGFAAIMGVTRQRVHDLETERRAAAERGDPHPFPAPVVTGWWVKAGAERYAATRKRKPGPAPKRKDA